MGKQKFCCKGVLRTTGQRVSVMVSADNREAALQIANQHGVAVESAMPVAEAAPTPPKIVEKPLGARIDDILDADDDDLPGGLDDLDLGDDLGGPAISPNLPTTKACPYCGEQILAVAVKCKHCGSYVGEKATQPRQPSGDAPSRGVPMRVWAIVGGIVAVAVIAPVVIVLAWIMWSSHSAAPVEPVPVPEPVVASPPPAAPSVPLPPPKPPVYTPSPEEMAFASKLTAFLDSCDEMTRLLEKVPKADEFTKQYEVMKQRCAAIPPPPQGVAWAADAVAASQQLVEKLSLVTQVINTLAGIEALEKPSSDTSHSSGNREAYRQAAQMMRDVTKTVRSQIPPACLAKPK